MDTRLLDRRALLLDLARSRDPADRDRLLQRLVDACEREGPGEGEEARTLLAEVLVALVARVELDIRERLARRLAGASWAPPALVRALAHDDIAVARPLIASSPQLRDHDLVRLLVETGVEHQVEVARRPGLGAAVVAAVLDQGSPEVLAALAGNTSATLTPFALERLVTFSQTLAGLRAPLARHPRLSLELGAMLYAWVGETLRASLLERFEVDRGAFDAAVAAAVAEARGAPGDGQALEVDERAAMDRRMVAKLRDGGQLRPGLLLRALKDGRLTLFTLALAELAGVSTDLVRQTLEAPTSELLALACEAAGMDRGVLPTVLALVRPLNGGRPGSADEPPRHRPLPGAADPSQRRQAAADRLRQRLGGSV